MSLSRRGGKGKGSKPRVLPLPLRPRERMGAGELDDFEGGD